ncbi:hypothetical protein BKA70DRAFT_1102390 [Coprinopsis sp. MPI-PUGE-AT-0042]|nr:hypothetical protein BKA70DRAFT_1102390 [Coprinopsis sp. MPI-PUGE-AT-0042]
MSDWDMSISLDDLTANPSTPRNSILFPKDAYTTPNADPTSSPKATRRTSHRDSSPSKRPNRTPSELLKLHAEKGTTCAFTQEEATRVGDVLDQWINASSSPYETEDDELFIRGKDDLFIPSRRLEALIEGRQRGMSMNDARPAASKDSSS